MKRASFWGVSSGRFCRSSQNHSNSASSTLLIRAQTWITVLLNGLPWKQIVIILLFFTLHSSTAFWTLCQPMRTTPFLLRYSCPQQIQWSSELNSPIPVHFSPLILEMSMFTLASSCLTTLQFALIHGPNIPGSQAILLFTASVLASITSHIHNWVLYIVTLFI